MAESYEPTASMAGEATLLGHGPKEFWILLTNLKSSLYT